MVEYNGTKLINFRVNTYVYTFIVRFRVDCKRKVGDLNGSFNDYESLIQPTLEKVINQTVSVSKPKLSQAHFDKANMELIVRTVSTFSFTEPSIFNKVL